jgi:hypothetical protein
MDGVQKVHFLASILHAILLLNKNRLLKLRGQSHLWCNTKTMRKRLPSAQINLL